MSYRSRLQPPLSAGATENPNLVPLQPQGNAYISGRFHNPVPSADAQQRTQLPIVTAPVIPATGNTITTVPVTTTGPVVPDQAPPA